MKHESALKYLSKRIIWFVLLTIAYLMIAFGGQSVSAAEGKFKGLEISPAGNRIELSSGETYSGQMSVKNSTDNDMDVKMSVGSYSIENNNYNSPNYDSPSKYSVMRDWVRLDKTEFVLEPSQSTVVNYTITVPDNPPSGMQYATIFASTTPESDIQGSGIAATSRVGMIIGALMKDGKTVDQANIENEHIAWYQPTSPLKATFSIKNEGNIGADIAYSLKVNNAFNGTEVYKSEAKTSSVYPESTKDFKLEWGKVGIGFYNVEMTINLNGVDHTVKKLVCTIPVWIIILIIIAILSLIAYAVINYNMAKDAKANSSNKTKKSTKKKSSK